MIAQMVKLVDTPASGAGDLTVVEVRVFFWAPIQIQGYGLGFHRNPRKRVFAFLASRKPAPLPPIKTLTPSQGASEKQYRLSLLQVFAMRQ
jgi:hypothetical protein